MVLKYAIIHYITGFGVGYLIWRRMLGDFFSKGVTIFQHLQMEAACLSILFYINKYVYTLLKWQYEYILPGVLNFT